MNVDECCKIGLERYVCNRMENKTCGKNRMWMCREGRLGQSAKEEDEVIF
jgi:hypothetical protein